MSEILRKIDSIGILIIDKHGKIIFSNEISEKYIYFHDSIIDSSLKGGQSFSLLSFPAEITSFAEQNNQLVILIQPIDEIIRLRKEMESLQEVKNELNEVLNSSFDGIVISDKNGFIIFQNPSYEKITGLSAKDCIGRNLQDLEIEKVIDSSATLKALQEDKAVTIIQKTITGSTVLVSAVPIRDKSGKIKKVVNNVRDLTHLNSLESEMQKLEKQNIKIHEELEFLKEQNDPKLSIIAYSDLMKDVLDRALRIAQIDSGVLIQGPSGVGKEKIVELIHRHSFRTNYPLIKINCGAIPEALLEAELFGYESGSFTGARQSGKSGLFEAANHGIIFLDEIGEMPSHLQVKLLRVLQEHEIIRVGGTKAIPIDIRVIAATHQDLPKMIENNQFREDLYFRLNIIPIVIPPLKDRKDDVIPLIYHFLKVINHKYGINRSFTTEVLNTFLSYEWPGNVRELQNFVERVILMSANPVIDLDDLQKEAQFNDSLQRSLTSSSNRAAEQLEHQPLRSRLENFEETIIQEAINSHSSIRKAATALEVDQSTLVRKMQKYKINK